MSYCCLLSAHDLGQSMNMYNLCMCISLWTVLPISHIEPYTHTHTHFPGYDHCSPNYRSYPWFPLRSPRLLLFILCVCVCVRCVCVCVCQMCVCQMCVCVCVKHAENSLKLTCFSPILTSVHFPLHNHTGSVLCMTPASSMGRSLASFFWSNV